MKFRTVCFLFLSFLLLGFDDSGCSGEDPAEPAPPLAQEYIFVRIFARAYTFDCPDGGARQITNDQYLIRFEFFKNNVKSSVHDVLSDNGYAFKYMECQMYKDDYFSVKTTVQGTTGDSQENTLFYKTALTDCDEEKKYIWRPNSELCVSY